MHLLRILATAAAVFHSCQASPITTADIAGKKTFTLHQVLNTSAISKTPAQKLLFAYQKFSKVGAVAPAPVRKAANLPNFTTVSTSPEPNDVSYLCPVNVGGRILNLNFDTGSADLWVFSSLQPSAQRSGHAYYNVNSANIKSGYTWDIEYGDGTGASGKVYADKVIVGAMTATSQAVEAATSVSDGFVADIDSDGILGLAFSTVNTVTPAAQSNFFDTIKSQLAKPLFTADLKKGTVGSYSFGFVDPTKYIGGITYVNVNLGRGFWEFSAGGYAIGSAASISKTYTCIADTGTSLMLLPSDIVSAYYKKVNGAVYSSYQGGWVFPCRTTLPSWTAVIGGQKFTVPGSYMNYAFLSDTLCFGGMQANTGIGFSILGDVFLKSQFVVFSQVNAKQPQLGFASKRL
jgi:hypothetical protein